MVTANTIILIVGLTAAIIVAVISVRVLTGRGWSNLSKKPAKPES
ncbi:MAG TPA: hypothetical protein VFJ63_03135 [Candidatus Bathyarchaeia archaeon]|nr:hypothetical protein [Candidatus Bathyarchaeia archaeon]